MTLPRLVFVIAIVFLATSVREYDDDLAVLTEGVDAIASPGTPGALAIVGEEAFPVVLGGSGKWSEPVVVASHAGRGRVVAFGHGGYLAAGVLDTRDTRRFMTNVVTWSARPGSGRAGPVRVAAVGRGPGEMASALAGDAGWRSATVEVAALADVGRDVDVVILNPGRNLTDEMIETLQRWVRAGGGLVVGGTGWGWQQLNGDRDLAVDSAMNRLCGPLGIVWTGSTIGDTTDDGFTIGAVDATLFNAPRLLRELTDGIERPEEVRGQIERTVVAAVRACDERRDPIRGGLRAFRRSGSAAVVPTPDAPIRARDVAARISVILDLEATADLAPARVRAHPAAEVFPGSVPAGARAVTRDVEIDLTRPRWHSTGLYAKPGAVVTVTGPSTPITGLRVRIGCHKDRLFGKDAWKRVPEVTMSRPLEAERTQIASAFGGLVYIEVPRDAGEGTVTVSVRGAIAAPYYVHGETDPERWIDVVREHPAPWGELASDRVIISLPSSVLRTLDDPGAVMGIWNAILDACSDLGQTPRDRRSPERMVPDVQISAGYMHSGYPIMTQSDVIENFVSTEKLLDGQWGFYHELGHNHQRPDWTFSGTTEVTCNLFALYVYETVCGHDLQSDKLHGGAIPPRRIANVDRFYDKGAGFEDWKRSPFLALTMYVQLAEAFGWDAYKSVFRTYRDLPADERPKNDQEKRDQWMVRCSREVGRNLGPFFEKWGVPTSDAARASIADLPAWEP